MANYGWSVYASNDRGAQHYYDSWRFTFHRFRLQYVNHAAMLSLAALGKFCDLNESLLTGSRPAVPTQLDRRGLQSHIGSLHSILGPDV
jgi:hypothetical protein